MSAYASQITSLAIVHSTVYSRLRSKKTSKLRVTGLCEGNSPVTGEFPAQKTSNAEYVPIWLRHHVCQMSRLQLEKWVQKCQKCQNIILGHYAHIQWPTIQYQTCPSVLPEKYSIPVSKGLKTFPVSSHSRAGSLKRADGPTEGQTDAVNENTPRPSGRRDDKTFIKFSWYVGYNIGNNWFRYMSVQNHYLDTDSFHFCVKI